MGDHVTPLEQAAALGTNDSFGGALPNFIFFVHQGPPASTGPLLRHRQLTTLFSSHVHIYVFVRPRPFVSAELNNRAHEPPSSESQLHLMSSSYIEVPYDCDDGTSLTSSFSFSYSKKPLVGWNMCISYLPVNPRIFVSVKDGR